LTARVRNGLVGWRLLAPWLAALVVGLSGCSSQRLPDDFRRDLTVAAQASGTRIRHAAATSRPEAAFAPLLAGYRDTLRLLCADLALDAKRGRGLWEWVIGASGLTSGGDGALDAETAKACGEARP
jgi:hypothetical protein